MILLTALLASSPPPERAQEPDTIVEIAAPPAPVRVLPPVEPDLDNAIAEPLLPMALPPPPPPPDGAGRLVGGALSISLGVAAFAAVAYEAERDAGDTAYVAGTLVPIGLASLGIGTYLIIRGAKARANHRHWESFTGIDAPRQGSGLLVGGTMLGALGLVSLVAGSLRLGRGQSGAVPTTLTVAGGTGVALGVLQLSLGFVARDRNRRWRRALVLAPTPTFGGGSTGVALVARF